MLQVTLPQHLMWSNRTDTDILRIGKHWGGAILPFNVGFRTDAMVVVRNSNLNVEGAIAATVEMKKRVVAQSLRQTKVTYVCASLKSHLPVISCVTDWERTAVAYYTTGQKRADGGTIVVEHIFGSPQELLPFLKGALSEASVPSNVLKWKDDTMTEIEIPGAHVPVSFQVAWHVPPVP